MNQKEPAVNSAGTSQKLRQTRLLFGCLLFSYPLLSFFWRHSYPIITTESLSLLTVALILSVVMTIIVEYTRKMMSTLVVAVILAVTFAIQFNLGLPGIAIIVAAAVIFQIQLKERFFLLCLPVLVMLIVGAFFDSRNSSELNVPANTQADSNELPPIVHIVLDGFIGMDGLPDYESSGAIRNEVEGFFEKHRFQLFPRAYSRYISTVNSLYSAFEFSDDRESPYELEIAAGEKHSVKQNLMFDAFKQLGYRFNVYQTDHLDFCQSYREDLNRCWSYSQPYVNSIQHAETLPLRIQMLTKVLLGQFDLFNAITLRRFYSQNVANHNPEVFKKLENDIVSRPDGNVFFAHVLLPHTPFTYLNDCSIEFGFPPAVVMSGYVYEPIRKEVVYQYRYGLYYNQIECALKSLNTLFESMEKAGIFERSVVLVHGDHGSMIGKYLPVFKLRDQIQAQDFRSAYSTLFAVKFPGGETGHDTRTLPLSFLLKEYTNSVKAFVSENSANPRLMQTLEIDPDQLDPHVFLSGSNPLLRVDIDIFDNDRQ
jgi:hypothetical protein